MTPFVRICSPLIKRASSLIFRIEEQRTNSTSSNLLKCGKAIRKLSSLFLSPPFFSFHVKPNCLVPFSLLCKGQHPSLFFLSSFHIKPNPASSPTSKCRNRPCSSKTKKDLKNISIKFLNMVLIFSLPHIPRIHSWTPYLSI